jgi:hypothetical protein
MILNGANCWNDGLFMASYSGHESIVRLLVSKGADDWNTGLKRAYDGQFSDEDRRFGFFTEESRRKQIRILSLMLQNGASNAESVFRLPADNDLLFDLLTTTPVDRTSLSAVRGIESVFARLDRLSNAVDAALAGPLHPPELRRLVIGFCVG